MGNEITSLFNRLLTSIEEMKKKYQQDYKNKAKEVFSSYLKLFEEYVDEMKLISQTENKVKQMDLVYNLNDYDVIKEYLLRKDQEMFKNYCK